jgi:hypothetical protein
VARGGNHEIQDVIDGGAPRSLADRLRLNGTISGKYHEIGSTAVQMVTRSRCANLTHKQQIRIVERHADAAEFAVDHLPNKRSTRGIAVAPVRAVIGRAFYSADHSKLIQFCDVLAGGLATREVDRTPNNLSQVLRSTGNGESRMSRAEKYDKTESALAAYLRGDVIQKIYASSTEKFPLPEEVSK